MSDLPTKGEFSVDCAFPGGNIFVDAIQGNTVFLRPDLRDTEGRWFYWYFRVRGAARRTLTFAFAQKNVMGVRGPAISTDGGLTWAWLGADAVHDSSFPYAFPDGANEVRFAVAIPYLQADLDRFLAPYLGHPALQADILCRSEKGRPVEWLRLGRLDGRCCHRVLLACRHHCCESIASFVLEGILEAVLAPTPGGQWFRENVEFGVVPFVDKDGVEEGDQGKNRRPHDHNRDYEGESRYASVRALREKVLQWSGGRLRFVLDLHCPSLPETNLYFVGTPDAPTWQRVGAFCRMLQEMQTGPLRYHARHNLPFGRAWNTWENFGSRKCFTTWATELQEVRFSSILEIPYADVAGVEVTPQSARALGHDLARALHRFLLDEHYR